MALLNLISLKQMQLLTLTLIMPSVGTQSQIVSVCFDLSNTFDIVPRSLSNSHSAESFAKQHEYSF